MGDILIVEDSAACATQMRVLLEQAGHAVNVVGSGRQAADLLNDCLSNDRLPDLIITDLIMPEMDGLELVEHVRDHHADIPIMLVTGQGSEQTAVQALRSGAASYLPKSELAHSLTTAVSEIMEMIAARQSREAVMDALVSAESTFVIGNDHQIAGRVIAHLEEQLRAVKYSDATGILRITMALREAVANAIDHGNLELDSAMRDDDGPGYSELGRLRAANAPWQDRRVTIRARVTPHEVCYTVSDEGPGFDPSTLPDPLDPENLLRAHGRGLMLIRSFMDEVTHNAAGNEITMIKRRPAELRTMPADVSVQDAGGTA